MSRVLYNIFSAACFDIFLLFCNLCEN